MPASVDRPGVIMLDPRTARPSSDTADQVAHALRVCFGALSIAQGVALRLAVDQTPVPKEQRPPAVAADVADLAMGTAWGVARLSGRLATSGSRVVLPLGRLLARPPLVPQQLQPGAAARRVIEGWRRDRPETVRSFRTWSATALPGVVDVVLCQVDVQQLVGAVLARVDLDALVADVLGRLDLSRTAELAVARLDLDRLVGSVLQSMDLTTIVAGVVRGLDLDRVVSEALDGLDLNTVVHRALQDLDVDQVAAQALDRVEMDVLVSRVVSTIDLNAVVSTVLARLDLAAVVDSALRQLDLTHLVVDEVDLGSLVPAALEQIDLIAVAEYVVDGIDLPAIIRDSTGSVASETVRVMRLQGVEGDAAIARAVDRMLHRRRRRQLNAIPEQPAATSEATPDESDAGARQ